MDQLNSVIAALRELEQDVSVPKNVKTRIANTIKALEQEKGEKSLKIHKALQELEEIADDANMDPTARTQLFNIVSLLEIV